MDEQTINGILEENKQLKAEIKRIRLYAQMYKREMERIDNEYQNLRTKLSAFVEGIGA